MLTTSTNFEDVDGCKTQLSAAVEIKIRGNLLLGQALAKNAADLLVVKTRGKGQLL